MIRSLLFAALLAVFAISTEAFVAAPFSRPALATTTSLDASRINAKQEKRKRNRENMRKFKRGGKRGTSRKKMMRKVASSAQRIVENEFIAKCFMTVPPPNSDDKA
mmetsp:Transcript_14428/g.22264  ORF Transcript_14428/g.22264 Transcript_14428/m.22264 type:complete len:106 (-) Transcript_14428:97-414(-)|eukprot:CAMPEP_0201713480 /NCGR_PEP_ID=MMETSP0593-20130828/304_1 /ASSEMBLY_ACC=CAM_ASM_000672 /TAXON_ID=267983 /ORGANISM="Skeletonema japonicum, Strain CCMP2506" /LENGTH=105 /DNA_ID=CAMNT_0048202629 /DNA_START=58 /DNA_END=375 /DNA_ORIENTATION=-